MQVVGCGRKGGASAVSRAVFLKAFCLLKVTVLLTGSETAACVYTEVEDVSTVLHLWLFPGSSLCVRCPVLCFLVMFLCS